MSTKCQHSWKLRYTDADDVVLTFSPGKRFVRRGCLHTRCHCHFPYYPSKMQLLWKSTFQCHEINVITFDAECHKICFVGRKMNQSHDWDLENITRFIFSFAWGDAGFPNFRFYFLLYKNALWMYVGCECASVFWFLFENTINTTLYVLCASAWMILHYNMTDTIES